MMFLTYKTHVNHNKKILLFTTLRCGSSACYDYLTPDLGWELFHGAEELHDIPKLQNYVKSGYKFYVLLKNPWLKLCSGFEMAVPGWHYGDVKISTEVFIQVLKERVHKNADWEIKRYGYANYVLGDAHLAWGNHVLMLFLESLGVPCEPLIMDTKFGDTNTELGYQTFNDFLLSLNDPKTTEYALQFSQHFTHDIYNKDNNEGYHASNGQYRFERAHAYINCCTQFPESGGKNKMLQPRFSVFDWMDSDNRMYNACLVINDHDSQQRQEFARTVLRAIIKNINSKTSLHDVLKDKRDPSIRLSEATGPLDSLIIMLDIFWDYRHAIPELYNFPAHDHLAQGRNPGKYGIK